MVMSFRSRPRFLCDVDDVVANYVQGFVSAVIATDVRPGIKQDHVFTEWDLSKSLQLTEEEDNKVYSLINMPGFASMLNPLPGAVEGVMKLMKIADVFFVTSPLKSSPTWAYDRRLWLEKLFGDDTKIVSTHEKFLVDGDFLLDDKPEHCSEWSAEHPFGWAMLWSTGRNAGDVPLGVPLVGHWELVYKLVEKRANNLAVGRK